MGKNFIDGVLDSLMALYVAADTAFILGGALAVITMSQCYSYIYGYFDRCACWGVAWRKLSSIEIDTADRSIINFEKNNLLAEAKEKSDFFLCDVCDNTLLKPVSYRTFADDRSSTTRNCCCFFKSETVKHEIPTKDEIPVPITITNKKKYFNGKVGEKTYHQDCLLKCFAVKERDPGTNLSLDNEEYEFKRYTGYSKNLRDDWRAFDTNNQLK